MKSMLIAICLVVAHAEAEAQSQWEQYGTELRRNGRGGVTPYPMLRPGSSHPKGTQPSRPWQDYQRRRPPLRQYNQYERNPY